MNWKDRIAELKKRKTLTLRTSKTVTNPYGDTIYCDGSIEIGPEHPEYKYAILDILAYGGYISELEDEKAARKYLGLDK
jgi:hypothetical protein